MPSVTIIRSLNEGSKAALPDLPRPCEALAKMVESSLLAYETGSAVFDGTAREVFSIGAADHGRAVSRIVASISAEAVWRT